MIFSRNKRRLPRAGSVPAKRSFKTERIATATKYFGVKAVILAWDSIAALGGSLGSLLGPAVMRGFSLLRKSFIGGILSAYFAAIKIKRRGRLLASASRIKLWNVITTYLYRTTIVVIIFGTLILNLGGKHLNAEELRSSILLGDIVVEKTEESIDLIEEGPLTGPQGYQTLTYVDQTSVVAEDYVLTNYAPDTDDDDVYAITEGDSAIIAPILTDPSALPSSRRDTILSYAVEAGDTISSIAQKFDVSVNTLLWENNLSFTSTIRPGDTLVILPASGVSHTVKSGETLSAIAKRYQAEVEAVVAQNKLADAGDIRVGEKLVIPNGIRPTAVTVRPRAPQSLPQAIAEVFTPSAPSDSGTKLLWPLISQRITQYFHLRHSGLDIGDKAGNPIYAAEGGKVERAGWNSGYGYNVIINHGNGVETLYGHASKLHVSAGDTVSRGDVIADIGSTGWSTGPHLHLEIRVNGRRVNPLNYIR